MAGPKDRPYVAGPLHLGRDYRSRAGEVNAYGYTRRAVVAVMAHSSPPGPRLWRALNILQRIAGFGAVAAGVIFATWAIWQILSPGAVPLDLSQDPRLAQAAVLAFGAVLLALGAVLLRARPYRPDLGDPLASGHDLRATRPTDSRRGWWTGDPIG